MELKQIPTQIFTRTFTHAHIFTVNIKRGPFDVDYGKIKINIQKLLYEPISYTEIFVARCFKINDILTYYTNVRCRNGKSI